MTQQRKPAAGTRAKVRRASRGAKPGNDNVASHSFCTEQFTVQEIALIGGFVADPSLDDEIWMQRVLNRRLMTHANAKDTHGDGPPIDVLIKLAEALTFGSGRVARLLRDKRVLSGDGADDRLAEAIEYGVEQMRLDTGAEM